MWEGGGRTRVRVLERNRRRNTKYELNCKTYLLGEIVKQMGGKRFCLSLPYSVVGCQASNEVKQLFNYLNLEFFYALSRSIYNLVTYGSETWDIYKETFEGSKQWSVRAPMC